MALGSGTHLGPYEITAQVGVGGMGEVYRATDINLARQVAIKVLPDAVGRRSARALRPRGKGAALTHPNIVGIYGLERTDGRAGARDGIGRGADPCRPHHGGSDSRR